MKIIYGEGVPYHSQRNNLCSPDTACGVTSIINGLASLGYSFPSGIGQAEDRLFKFIEKNPECRALYASKNQSLPIYVWQDILALGTNRWMGNPNLAFFREKATKEKILDWLVTAGVCVVTGDFPTSGNKTLSHSVCLNGVECRESFDLNKLDQWFIKDPWGDFRTLYRIVYGDKVNMTPEEFSHFLYTKDENAKWCIFLRKKGG